MANIEHETAVDGSDSAFQFHGNWKDFARIALPNLLLTIVTLGIYRFWATTRERQYLWNQTQFIDDQLEWAGKGLELLIGFVAAIFLVGIPFVFIQFGAQAMVLRGMPGMSLLLTLASFIALFWFVGVGRFRGIRYRLSRTYWRGIRGGSNDSGLGYGWAYVWKTFVGSLAAGLMVPWTMVNLWNERWGRMSFGPHDFNAYASQDGLMPRYLLFYIAPILSIIVTVSFGIGPDGDSAAPLSSSSMLLIALFPLIFYAIVGFVGIFYYAKFFETVIGGMSLENLEFGFKATNTEWLKLAIGNVLLVIATLGFGLVFLPYRNWKFFTTHLEAYGTIELDNLTQSQTEMSKHGEGLLDAFDIGAI
jgi:uncharacterized membrane protein YjgN (DUF898 family)